MTRLWILSDLHLEAVRHPEAFRPDRPVFDVLVVAGDVWQGDIDRGMRIVAGLADGKPVVFVLGNHEFWNHQVDRQRQHARRAANRHRVLLLDDTGVEVSGLRFVGGTLWGDGHLAVVMRRRTCRPASGSWQARAGRPTRSRTRTRRHSIASPGQ